LAIFPLRFARWRRIDGCPPCRVKVGNYSGFSLAFHQEQSMTETAAAAGLAGIKYIVAVASGKGGVGKSTTAVNLALAFAANGQAAGLLDADIYGPSQAKMLGLGEDVRPRIVDQKYMKPVRAHGIGSMSMGYLATDNTPMVWRGPMAGGALIQMLEQTLWGDLDILVVDMPPGTGDIQLTLAQKAAVSGSVIVTTPQDIALLDARKGIEMFRKVNIPVLGIVENMAMHICSNCGHAEPIFGEGGGAKVASEYQVPVLGSLPLDRRIREETDSGTPTMARDPQGPLAAEYRGIARKVWAALEKLDGSGPVIVFE